MTFIGLVVEVVLIILVIGLIMLGIFNEKETKKLQTQIETNIKSLSLEDFDIVSGTTIGTVDISPYFSERYVGNENTNAVKCRSKKLNLSGKAEILVTLPDNSISIENRDFLRAIFPCLESIWISEKQYTEFMDLTKGYNKVSTTSYFLKIKLKNKDVISLIKRWNKQSERGYIVTEYQFERYNVLNIVTDMKPFSDKEINMISEKIKSRMIERLHNAE